MEAVLFRSENLKSEDFFSAFKLSGTSSWPRGSIYCRRKPRQQQRVKKGEDGEGRPGDISNHLLKYGIFNSYSTYSGTPRMMEGKRVIELVEILPKL